MPEAELALQHAAAGLPADLTARLAGGGALDAADRAALLALARGVLAP